MRRYVIPLVLLFSVAAVLPAAAQDYTPTYTNNPCPFPFIDGVVCGTLTVPEDRANPTGPQVELNVVILQAANNSPLPDPVIYLEGGPGGAGSLAAEDFADHPLRQNRDLILLDQRGTGFSQPSLNCIELEDEDADDLAILDCRDRLTAEGVNLAAYNSAANAADVNDLRIAMGYEQVNLWGISYGTRLALTILRDYPESVRAAVIDAVYPPEIDTLEQVSADSTRAFEYLLDACAADAACNDAYPDLREDFYFVVDEFNFEPVTFEYFDGEEYYDIDVTGDDILDAMFQAMYDSSIIPMLPYGITLMAYAEDDINLTDAVDILSGYYTVASWNGEFSDFPESVFESDMVLDYYDEFGDISDSEGMYSSVECAEEVPFNDEDAAFATVNDIPVELQDWVFESIESQLFECEDWNVPTTSAIEAERVQSDVPVLLISGAFDPITPPSYGDSALQGLPNGQHIVFPTGSHGDSSSSSCAAGLTRAFVDDPSAMLDTGCVEPTVAFYIEPLY